MRIPLYNEQFEFAVNRLLEDEGGFSNLPADRGGATNFGITQNELTSTHEKLNLPANVFDLTREEAIYYYQFEWWDKFHYDKINSLDISSKIFNMAVNMGASQAHKLTQLAINYCGYTLPIDGILGVNTIGALNEICMQGREIDLKTEIQKEQENFYKRLVINKPELKIFLKGWLNRATH